MYPDVAVDNMGRRIHVWSAAGTGLVSTEVFMRRWDSAGNPLVDPMMVNTTTEAQQQFARVAVSADGSFLVIYQSWEQVPPGVNRIRIRSQAFGANGNPVGAEQLLSTLSTLEASNAFADVAALRTPDGSGGGFAVVWKSNQASGSDTNWSIEGCLVNTAGIPGAQFQVNSNTGTSQSHPSVTELQDGGFLATWQDYGDVWGRRFNAGGAALANDFQISTLLTAQVSEVDAAIGWNGNVLVVWADSGDDVGTGTEVRGRLFDADLAPLGPDFRINTVTDNAQTHPRIADYGPAGFLVVWGSSVSSGADLGVSIEARVVTGPNAFDHDGDGIDDSQVQYNTWDNDNNQQFPGAHGWYGRLSADWRSLTWDGVPPLPIPTMHSSSVATSSTAYIATTSSGSNRPARQHVALEFNSGRKSVGTAPRGARLKMCRVSLKGLE